MTRESMLKTVSRKSPMMLLKCRTMPLVGWPHWKQCSPYSGEPQFSQRRTTGSGAGAAGETESGTTAVAGGGIAAGGGCGVESLSSPELICKKTLLRRRYDKHPAVESRCHEPRTRPRQSCLARTARHVRARAAAG